MKTYIMHTLSFLKGTQYSFFTAIIILCCLTNFIYPQTRGGQGELRQIQTFDKGKIINKAEMVQSFDYTVELFPGQSFQGWYYFWYYSNGDTMRANFQVPSDVSSWLSISPSRFSSDSCNDIVAVAFNFNAPLAPGDYVTTIKDSDGNWSDINVTCTVTNSPAAYGPYYADSIALKANSDTVAHIFTFLDWSPGCAEHYSAADVSTLYLETFPYVPWFKVPGYTFINLNDSAKVDFIFSNDTTGSYYTYLIETQTTYSHPNYYLYFRTSGFSNINNVADKSVPETFNLYQNYPNPFNPTTKIKYSIPKLSYVTLKVYNALGQEVTTLVKEVKPAGNYEINWDANNMASGIYFYQIKTGEYAQTKKMILLK